MNANELRLAMVNQTKSMHEIWLSEPQVQLYKDVLSRKEVGMRANELANLYNTTVHNASTRLKELYVKDYLRRELYSCMSGGIEYTYFACLGE